MAAVGRSWLFLAAVAAALALNVYYFATMPSAPQAAQGFSQESCDRPVLVTRQQVWDATVSGEYPREYVEYAAWYVRLD